MSEALIVFCTCPDAATARRLAEAAVAGEHAACVNELAGVNSVFRWEGEVTVEREVLLLAKTTTAAYPGLAALWQALHPYELPELVAVPIATGSDSYLAWLNASTKA
ncbi:MAG: divalent-cation tolerance protein CutA [Gammaproteobacteria bacterium]